MPEDIGQNCALFKAAVEEDRLEAANRLLNILKVQLMDVDSLPPLCFPSPSAEQERALARSVFEQAVLLAVKNSDKADFQRYLHTLKPYYIGGLGNAVSESDLKSEIVGLHLLFLLVENQLADFHSELELLSEQQQSDPAISFCTELERHLMSGSYDQVMRAAAAPPVPHYSFFLGSLLLTVRLNICECVLASYRDLTPQAAMGILMFSSLEETVEFFADNFPDLQVSASTTSVDLCRQDGGQKSDQVPSMKLIGQTLSYASELERIV